jgi:23S rRNA (adenine2030-N6)-methyltransferase
MLSPIAPMNYRHEYHAGNFADVVKHLALVAILLHLKKKDAPFAVIDTHAGRGLYRLSGEKAARTGEAEGGIARLAELSGGPPALETYLDLVRSSGTGFYPGSPLIAAKLLRPSDRLVAIEKHPEEFAALKATLAPYAKARAVEADGYARLKALLPPPERRGLVLIDPPYEKESEFADAAHVVSEMMRRFATGIALVWFPLKSPRDADAFTGEVLAAGVKKLLRVDIETGPRAEAERLSAAGIAVVNPPYGFAGEMRASLDRVAPLLGRKAGAPAQVRLDWIAGEE